MIVKTPLYQIHTTLGAKMVDFHGWHMPIHYGSQLQEHNEVRTNCGLFDVSHMTIVDVLGTESRQFLRHLLTNNIDQLQHVGRAIYSCMCNHDGGIIDDLIVYQRSPDHYRLVLNAATRANDLAWIRQHIQGFAADIQERTDLAMIAIQGPKAIEKTLKILTPAQADAVSTIAPFECVEAQGLFVARTGYTGEDGLELIADPDVIIRIWQDFVAMGAAPCGLAARDTLRIEAGLLLYGQDMSETTTPLESSLSWTVSWPPPERDSIGLSALQAQRQEGVQRKLVGITLKDKVVMRTGQRVIIEGLDDGVITSGTFSPSLQHSIGFARVPVATKEEVWVEIRDKRYRAKVGKLRFINKGQNL